MAHLVLLVDYEPESAAPILWAIHLSLFEVDHANRLAGGTPLGLEANHGAAENTKSLSTELA